VLGNHTWSHPDLTRLGDRELRTVTLADVRATPEQRIRGAPATGRVAREGNRPAPRRSFREAVQRDGAGDRRAG
jgi:peptidoglycan/xylan/chitin deacetylase (PgdA/CDA1 family)